MITSLVANFIHNYLTTDTYGAVIIINFSLSLIVWWLKLELLQWFIRKNLSAIMTVIWKQVAKLVYLTSKVVAYIPCTFILRDPGKCFNRIL